ncbi:sugar nucleotide-binding protein [Azospirillum halopraeferens]|uniref:sugar nucleotide-binding protein n=1 Tax=Azospirillum halopraeferens TaxID=34010 RepID=UPI001B3BD500|nr:sugar nucleotide-binding protein [Azospirillum halopraeferens]
MDALVVGIDGVIGRALAARLAAGGTAVTGTSRRVGAPRAGVIPLDLAEPPDRWVLPARIGTAWLLAGVTAQAACRTDPTSTGRINVTHTVALAQRLAAAGAFVVFASTNLVLDGSRPRQPADSPLRPLGAYGAQKAAAEEGLRTLADAAAVVRLSKVLAPDFVLIRRWVEDLRAGRPVTPFSDLMLAPTSLDFAVEALVRVGRARRGGVYQVSAADELSYADLAHGVARRMAVDPGLVRPTTSVASGIVLDALPRHATMDASRLEQDLSLPPPPPEAALDACLTPDERQPGGGKDG